MDRGQAAKVEANPSATLEKVVEADSVEGEHAPAKRQVEYVLWVGERPGIRLITAADWEGAGVKDHPDTYWNLYNDYRVKRSDLGLTEEQFNRIIRMDNGFRVELAEESAS